MSDAWLRIAEALREDVLAHAAVNRLSEAGHYETRGRGGTVHGLALRDKGSGVLARTGVMLDIQHVDRRSLDRVIQEIRSTLLEHWQCFGDARELVVDVDVLDLDIPL